jgi:exopolyphosphatase/guanosine-5'-triphosphate,3'-diphosphate pyrophosphatase
MLVGMIRDREVSLISRFSQTVKLEVSTDGILAEGSKHRLIRALAQCHKLIKKHRIRRYRCVGTAACRAIHDSEEFTREIKRKTGIALEIISPKEEIRLAAIGAKSIFDAQTSIKFVFDIGGGSSDMGAFEYDRTTGNLRCIAHASLPYGILTTSQISNQSIKDAILRLAQDITSSVLTQCNIPASQMQVISTSGPLATIVTLSRGLRGYHGPHIHGYSISYPDALHWIAQLQQIPREQFSNDYGISHGLIAGLPILRGILDALQTEVYISNAGLRHGMLSELLTQTKKHKLQGNSDNLNQPDR